jgi:ADP-heptose:LPS heptosyltransferase
MPEPEFMLPEIRFEDKEGEWIDFYLKSGGLDFDKPIIGIYPGSSQPNRIWLHERVIQLSEKLLESNHQVLYIKGPNQGSMLQKIMDRVPNSILCTDVLPLRKLAVLLSRLDVFVGNAGAVLNLAIAVGTKTVGILGPDRPDMEFPYPVSSDYTAVYQEIDCRPCHDETCPLGTMECMYKVEVETVYKAIREALH